MFIYPLSYNILFIYPPFFFSSFFSFFFFIIIIPTITIVVVIIVIILCIYMPTYVYPLDQGELAGELDGEVLGSMQVKEVGR